ncbi:MAG: polysaccharide export protein [Acidobacteriota bacterium]
MERSRTSTVAAGLVVIMSIGLSGSLLGQEAEQAAPLYVIQPNDILEVFVWKEPDLSRRVLVRPDGRISFPLVQDLQAAGLTPVELKAKIEELLKQFIASPNVTVIVEEIRNYRIYVTGKVNNPGSFTLEKPVTVLQALSLAGGFAEFADEGDIKIVRTYGDKYMYLDFNYKDVIKGKNTQQNIVLRSGDVVVVP